jgi:3-methyladenine DNA glycosylase AlkD
MAASRTIEEWVAAVRTTLTAVADPSRAPAMTAYMHDIAPFLGVATPDRRAAVKPLGTPDLAQVAAVATALFAEPEREFAYVAVDWITRAAKRAPVALLDTVEQLIRTTSWWDTVDGLARAVGHLVRSHPELIDTMRVWVHDDSVWIARAAVLHQLGWGLDTDRGLLFELCVEAADETGRTGREPFFIRKAIGWALRDLAWRDPGSVQAFLNEHGPHFHTLTIREATKNLARTRAE